MAVFSLIALLVLLAGVALLSLRPWEPDALEPQVRVSPGIGVGLGDSVAVASARRSAVPAIRIADAHVAGAGRAAFVAEPEPAPDRGSAADRGSAPELGISQSRPVAHVVLRPAPAPRPSELPPVPAPVPAISVPAAEPPPAPVAEPLPEPPLVADFENGLRGWSTAAVGDAVPMVFSGIARDGKRASAIRLTGDQSRSQLIFGGDGSGSNAGIVQVREGDEYAFAFSFYIRTLVYGEPGADNLLMRLEGDAGGRSFGLQLWDHPADVLLGGGRGLWSSGEEMGGERFLAPVSELAWHDAIVFFKASGEGAGFYEIYLDGHLVDARSGVSTIAPGNGYAQIAVGLDRDGELVQGTSEIFIDAAKLGDTLESVRPPGDAGR